MFQTTNSRTTHLEFMVSLQYYELLYIHTIYTIWYIYMILNCMYTSTHSFIHCIQTSTPSFIHCTQTSTHSFIHCTQTSTHSFIHCTWTSMHSFITAPRQVRIHSSLHLDKCTFIHTALYTIHIYLFFWPINKNFFLECSSR